MVGLPMAALGFLPGYTWPDAETLGFEAPALPEVPALGPAAPLAEVSSAAGSSLGDQIRRLVEAGGPDLNPGTIVRLQTAATAGLVGACGALAPAVAPTGGGAAYAPTGRFLTQAIGRMAQPGAPDPGDVACRLTGRQSETVVPGMLADGPANILPEPVRRVLEALS